MREGAGIPDAAFPEIAQNSRKANAAKADPD